MIARGLYSSEGVEEVFSNDEKLDEFFQGEPLYVKDTLAVQKELVAGCNGAQRLTVRLHRLIELIEKPTTVLASALWNGSNLTRTTECSSSSRGLVW